MVSKISGFFQKSLKAEDSNGWIECQIFPSFTSLLRMGSFCDIETL